MLYFFVIPQAAPKDQLLIYSVKEGWEPLCRFLNEPVPDKAFPHKNKAGGMIEDMMKNHHIAILMQREAMLSGTIIVAFTGWLMYNMATRSRENSVLSKPQKVLNFIIKYFGYRLISANHSK